MRRLFVLLLFLVIRLSLIAQQDYHKKVKDVKQATVLVVVDGQNAGSGFFINKEGGVLTCWHVVSPAFHSVDGKSLVSKNLQIVTENGSVVDMYVADYFWNISRGLSKSVLYDHCLLLPRKQLDVPFLEIGDFENLREGDDVYTCGYPFGLNKSIVSHGILSTIYNDTIKRSWKSIAVSGQVLQGIVDMTMNRGNSGGPILKVSPDGNDKVIGIADFIITPAGEITDSLLAQISKGRGVVELAEVDPNEVLSKLSRFATQVSVGIGGIVVINHFLHELTASGLRLSLLKKKQCHTLDRRSS